MRLILIEGRTREVREAVANSYSIVLSEDQAAEVKNYADWVEANKDNSIQFCILVTEDRSTIDRRIIDEATDIISVTGRFFKRQEAQP